MDGKCSFNFEYTFGGLNFIEKIILKKKRKQKEMEKLNNKKSFDTKKKKVCSKIIYN